MKILYISNPNFLDYDLSFVQSLSKQCEVTYLMDLPPYLTKATALSMESVKHYPAIIESKEFKELHKFDKYISLSKFFVVNRTSKKTYHSTNLKMQFEVVNFIKKNKPDIIHCSSFLDMNFFLFLFLHSKKYKILLNVHDPIPHSSDIHKKKPKLIRKANFSKIKNIILFNSHQKEQFKEKTTNYNFKNILISKLGIYEYLNDYRINKSLHKKFRILFFGRIEPYKGINILLDAFSQIEDDCRGIELIIAGKGEYTFDIELYKNNPKIKFLNRFIENAELVQIINDASIVVCPYLDATQSGVLMAAFALNKPVLATNVGAFPEIIDSGKTGFIVPSNDSNALAEKIKYLIEDPDMLANMQECIKNSYNLGCNSWESIVNEVIVFYKTILKS